MCSHYFGTFSFLRDSLFSIFFSTTYFLCGCLSNIQNIFYPTSFINLSFTLVTYLLDRMGHYGLHMHSLAYQCLLLYVYAPQPSCYIMCITYYFTHTNIELNVALLLSPYTFIGHNV